jgi:hypothetical protein
MLFLQVSNDLSLSIYIYMKWKKYKRYSPHIVGTLQLVLNTNTKKAIKSKALSIQQSSHTHDYLPIQYEGYTPHS